MEEHRSRRKHWYAHELVPWEEGRSFVSEPWDESQASLAPDVRTALVLNLLTEDNLPYYHSELIKHLPEDSAYSRWARLWTAEEGQHAIAIRSYLLTSRNCDPKSLEDDRMATMEAGFAGSYTSTVELLVYTVIQELATRVSHRNAGKRADDEVAYNLMARIAADENHHFLFYRGVVTAMLEQAPTVVVPAIYRMLSSFAMPGTKIPNYLRRAVAAAKASVYNLRIHANSVVSPLLRDWDIGALGGLTAEAAELQEKLMALPERILRRAEAFERRAGLASA